MNITHRDPESALDRDAPDRDARDRDALDWAALERDALEPVVPGEAALWVDRVTRALDRFREAWRHEGSRRRSRREAIPVLDAELTRRSDRLRDSEHRLDEELEELAERGSRIARDAREPASDGGPAPVASESRPELEERARRIRSDLLHWTIEARMLLAEIDAWFEESVYRDRGEPG